MPQFLSSLNLLMQSGPQAMSGASQRERHLNVPCSPQTGVGSVHRVVQSPHCSGVSKGGVHTGPSDEGPSPAERSPLTRSVDTSPAETSPVETSPALASSGPP